MNGKSSGAGAAFTKVRFRPPQFTLEVFGFFLHYSFLSYSCVEEGRAPVAAVRLRDAVGAAIIGNLSASVPRRVRSRALQERLLTQHHNKVRRRRLLDNRQKEFLSTG